MSVTPEVLGWVLPSVLGAVLPLIFNELVRPLSRASKRLEQLVAARDALTQEGSLVPEDLKASIRTTAHQVHELLSPSTKANRRDQWLRRIFGVLAFPVLAVTGGSLGMIGVAAIASTDPPGGWGPWCLVLGGTVLVSVVSMVVVLKAEKRLSWNGRLPERPEFEI